MIQKGGIDVGGAELRANVAETGSLEWIFPSQRSRCVVPSHFSVRAALGGAWAQE